MSPSRAYRGLTALLALHALRSAFAFALLGPLYRELARAMDRSTFHAAASPVDAALALEVIERAAPRMLPGALVALGLYALLGPWLQQTLLHALAGSTLREAATRAAQRYLAALATRSVALLAFLALAAATVLALQALLIALPASALLETLARSACVALVLAAALLLASAHDLAFAALANGARLRSGLRAGITRCTRAALGRHLLALAAATALVAIGELAGHLAMPLPYALGPGIVLLIQQCLLLAALGARAAWLAHALERTRELSPPRP